MSVRRAAGESDLVDQTELLSWAQVRIMEGRPAEVLASLEELRAEAVSAGWLRLHLESIALLALAWQAEGDPSKALAYLEEALALAEPEGYVALFVDLGPPMTWLLAEAGRRAASRPPHLQAYLTRFLAAYSAQGNRTAVGLLAATENGTVTAVALPAAAGHPSIGSAWIEPLSEREVEVLRLVAAGLSNRAIADRLYISLATVKTHAHHIYQKLSVQDRQGALRRAVELGLLDGHHPS